MTTSTLPHHTPAPTIPPADISRALAALPDAELPRVLRYALESRRRARAHASRDELIAELDAANDANRELDIHFNHLAERIDAGRHPKHWRWRAHKQFFLDRTPPATRVLDVGCGASAYLLWMAQQGAHVTAWDLNPARIEQARALMHHPNLTFEVRDAVAQPPSAPFDVVICSHVIEHIDDPVPMLAALTRCAPRLLVAVPPMDRSWHKILLRDLGLRWKDDEDHRREYTPQLLSQQLNAAGWSITHLHDGYDIKADCTRA